MTTVNIITSFEHFFAEYVVQELFKSVLTPLNHRFILHFLIDF
jgi:hypothetical protein